jgi:hypothetical protein
MNGTTNPQLESKKPNYQSKRRAGRAGRAGAKPRQDLHHKLLLGNTIACLPQVKKLVTKQTIPMEMRKKK